MAVHILGLSAYYHDSAACIVRDGDILAAAQEERFTRKKHDAAFPSRAVEYCLREAGITADQVDHVAFYDKPLLKFERLLETYLAYAPSGFGSFIKSMPLWLKEKLWMGDMVQGELGIDRPILYPEHHQSHAASAFFPSPFENAALITFDGVGEWTTTSWGVGTGNRIDLQHEIRFPHSIGLLYSAITYYLGFKVMSGEYKVMGLAPYGEPRFTQLMLDNLMDMKEDGSFRLNMKYFNYPQGLTMTSRHFDELFGAPPREPESLLTQRDMDIARSLQDVTELLMVRTARHVRRETGERNLCLAGGVALNCVGNGKILEEGIFDSIWIQPAAGDAGGALGAALFTWYQVLGNKRVAEGERDMQRGSYLGPSFASTDIAAWLESRALPYTHYPGDEVSDAAAELIADGKVVGWFSGRMEFGPRALGARSIIGDARDEKMQSVMNLKIKFRESFRPFAPSCLLEDAEEVFGLKAPSPYMLLVAPVQEKYRKGTTREDEGLFGIDKLNVPRSVLPAITHVDYSARIQTVDSRDHVRFHRLISEFKKRSGFGVIINTSFNVRGEPIVCTPEEAYLCFMRTGIDALVLEDLILLKTEQPALSEDSDWQREYVLD